MFGTNKTNNNKGLHLSFVRSAPWQSTPLADVANAFFLLLVRKPFHNNNQNCKRRSGIVSRDPTEVCGIRSVSPPCTGVGASAHPTPGSAIHPTFRKHLHCLASLSRQGPATGGSPSLFFWKRSSHTPSLSILIRMAVSAFSANPWALHLPPGPTWHSSNHLAKLCFVVPL